MEGERHLPYLIEEESATISLFEASRPRLDRTGEGTALMAEEFTLDQTLRDRGRIDSDEGSIPSLTQFMDSSSDDLLTRSTLTGYDSEGITGSECLDHSEKLAHCSTLPDEKS